MKLKAIIFLFSLTTCLNISAQEVNGYIIGKNNDRTDVIFKKSDYTDFTSIRYKTSEDSDFQRIDMNVVTEFGIANDYKFVQRTVKHDKEFNTIAYKKDPVLTSESLFLNVLSEGDMNLYSFTEKGRTKYFYGTNNSQEAPAQLIYRRYYADSRDKILENTFFRNQLNDVMKCDALVLSDFLNLKYRESDLTKLFAKYNTCKNAGAKVYENASGGKAKIKFSVLAGVHQSSLSIESNQGESEKATETTFSFGGEVALLTPSRKFEIFARGEFETYSGQPKYSNNLTGTARQENFYTLDSDFINLNLGGRYNFYRKEKHKFFAEGSVGINIPTADSMDYQIFFPEAVGAGSVREVYFLGNSAFFQFAVGYTFNDKFGIDLRADTSKNILENTRNDESTKFSRIGLNLKYTIN